MKRCDRNRLNFFSNLSVSIQNDIETKLSPIIPLSSALLADTQFAPFSVVVSDLPFNNYVAVGQSGSVPNNTIHKPTAEANSIEQVGISKVNTTYLSIGQISSSQISPPQDSFSHVSFGQVGTTQPLTLTYFSLKVQTPSSQSASDGGDCIQC